MRKTENEVQSRDDQRKQMSKCRGAGQRNQGTERKPKIRASKRERKPQRGQSKPPLLRKKAS